MMSMQPRTRKGEQTKRRILEAAEAVFAEQGYHDASVSRITEHAGVGQGTFYLYFESKLDLFEELVVDLNRRVRQAMRSGAEGAKSRAEAERGGFKAFFEFTREHPALYRVVREAEFVAPEANRQHYIKLSSGYIGGLERAKEAGEISGVDPTVAAWALMGVGELVGKRWVLWGDEPTEVPDDVLDKLMDFINAALGVKTDKETS